MDLMGATSERGKLLEHEVFWSQHYDLLKTNGFQLRSRYKPGWHPGDVEEELLYVSQSAVMDATRVSDGKKVCLKRISNKESLYTRELSVRTLFESGNHCVPVMNFIPLSASGELIAVMPFLRVFDDPKFETLGEILEAIGQFLEGIEFIHKQNMAHRDACWLNLMMDTTEVIPDGFHFACPWTKDGFKPFESVPRSNTSMHYYFIDFELTVYVKSSDPMASGVVGQDRTVPEFQGQKNPKYNPQKLDIYQLGNVFKTRIIKHYEGVDCLGPLVDAMTHKEPSERPTASKAREMFQEATTSVDPKSVVALKPGIDVSTYALTDSAKPQKARPKALKNSKPQNDRLSRLKGWLSPKAWVSRIRKFFA